MQSVLLQKSSTVSDCPLAWAAKLTNCGATTELKVSCARRVRSGDAHVRDSPSVLRGAVISCERSAKFKLPTVPAKNLATALVHAEGVRIMICAS